MNLFKIFNQSKYSIFLSFSIILFTYSLFLSIFSIADFPTSLVGGYLPYLSDKPIGEDGFYMLKVAWNIANGDGITYSTDQLTSGIQPAITFFYSLIAFINIHLFNSNKWLFLREIIIIGTLTHIYLSFLIGNLSLRILSFLKSKQNFIFNISSSLTLFSFGLWRLSTYGLETTFYLCAWCSFYIYLLDNLSANKTLQFRRTYLVGLFSGSLILIRIDAIVILFVTAFILFFSKKISSLQILKITFISSLVASPWFIYTYQLTGKFMPSSGGAQSDFINSSMFLERLDPFLKALFSHFSSFFTVGRNFLFFGSFFVFIYFFIIIFFNKKVRENLKNIFYCEIYISCILSFSTLFLYYFLTSEAKHFYYRYTSISILIFTPFITLIIIEIAKFRVVYIYLFSLLIFSGQALGSLHSGNIHNSHAVTAGYINRNFQKQEYVIGAFQSGVVGFFNERVINLDGKLDHLALNYLGGSTILNEVKNNNIVEYITKKDINVIVDWEDFLRRLVGKLIDDPNSEWRECPIKINNKFGYRQSMCITKR